MAAKHTPGPWAVGFSDGSGSRYITAGDHAARKDLPVLIVGAAEDSFGVPQGVLRIEDARLIAEAPAMLAELVRLAESFGWDESHPARKIIAKATGESK